MPKKRITTIAIQVEFVISPDEDEYHIFCPAFKGVHAFGKTKEEALENGKNAVQAYIDSLLKHNDPIPCCIFKKEEIFEYLESPETSTFTENILVPAFA
jgi:predicted RNase H-like HicB family nuclease